MATTSQSCLPPKKRRRSLDSDSTHQFDCASDSPNSDGFNLKDLQGAEVLTCLRGGVWETKAQAQAEWGLSTAREDLVSYKHLPQAISIKKRSGSAPTTRAYVWRCPSRKAVNPQVVQEMSPETLDNQASTCGGHKSRDKDWSALTTWLRMNLHQPRTLKKQVLFVGYYDDTSRRWGFELNHALSWEDVSTDTKLRLKTLVKEAEDAFASKYPRKPRSDWGKKSQKYKPLNSGHIETVPMADMVQSLQLIYQQHESCAQDSDETEGDCATQAEWDGASTSAT